MSKPNPFGTEEFVRFRQVFWFTQIQIKEIFSRWDCKICLVLPLRLVFGLHSFTIYRMIIYSAKLGLGLWCLMQLSTIFQVYHG